ncbi:unnamed protein product [Brachionus calyciflorus]|uniref:Chromo domain-containing protein n=1 Tax=Brachionus calyciflorus TaxID=104777 RepID=A0A813PIV3_9BILA|nr:unnamed protein product [Brachionus calyciflorus]
MKEDRKLAKDNIDKAKEIQVKIQDKNKNVIVDRLKPGTKVYITIEGLQNKLTPKYRGPYTIVKSTKNDNLILKNVLGEVLKDSYPLCKLKLDKGIDDEIDNFQKFEKILHHRKVKNGYEYLILWVHKDQTWEPASNFSDKTVIENY